MANITAPKVEGRLDKSERANLIENLNRDNLYDLLLLITVLERLPYQETVDDFLSIGGKPADTFGQEQRIRISA